MSRTPEHQDIGITLNRYDVDKALSKADAASRAYLSVIDELAYRGWFENFPDSLSLEVRTFFYVLFADNEIRNGGFAAYFYNGYGQYAEDTVKAYKDIGAPQKSSLLATIMASFPAGEYPKTVDEYDHLLETKEEELSFLDEEDIEDKYLDSEENIEELMLSYIKSHFDKFSP